MTCLHSVFAAFSPPGDQDSYISLFLPETRVIFHMTGWATKPESSIPPKKERINTKDKETAQNSFLP